MPNQKNILSEQKNISVIWDFDKTLTPLDSTTELIKVFLKKETDIREFWKRVQKISGTASEKPIGSISTSDAPVWMHMLSEIAVDDQDSPIPLNRESLFKLISHKINFYPKTLDFLKRLKELSSKKIYKENNIKIHL